MQLTWSSEKVEDIRGIGIFIGPVLLASVVGNAIYGVVFGTTAINVIRTPFLISVMFLIAGTVIAWRMTEPIDRMAWAVFALYHGIQVLLVPFKSRMGNFWSVALITLFAALVTGSGVRGASRRTLLLSSGIFVVAVVAVFAARYYADELLGNHSVIR